VTTVQAVTAGVTISDPGLGTAGVSCLVPGAGSCTAPLMAAYDVQQWAAALQVLLPGSFSTITCTTVLTAPVTCTIQIQWVENAVAANAQQTTINTLQAPTYILYVEP
jgi:type IV pilus assembly protein PilV